MFKTVKYAVNNINYHYYSYGKVTYAYKHFLGGASEVPPPVSFCPCLLGLSKAM